MGERMYMGNQRSSTDKAVNKYLKFITDADKKWKLCFCIKRSYGNSFCNLKKKKLNNSSYNSENKNTEVTILSALKAW